MLKHPRRKPTHRKHHHPLRFFRGRNKGFTLPMVIGLGLIIVLIGLTILTRSQIDKVTSISQKDTARAFAIAEGGLARTLGLLNGNFQVLLRATQNPTNSNTGQAYLINRTAAGANTALIGQPNDTPVTVTALEEWTNAIINNPVPCVDSGSASAVSASLQTNLLTGTIAGNGGGTYQVLAYLYDSVASPTTAYLLVRGNVPNSTANAYVVQKMSIVDKNVPANFPGLLAEDIDLGNNDVLGSVAGNVLCTRLANCPIPSNQCVNGQPTLDGLRAAVGALNNSIIQGTIAVGSVNLPAVPTAPPAATVVAGVTVTPGSYNLGALSNGSAVKNFPRTGDIPYNGAYHYVISSISLSGNASNSLTFDTAKPYTSGGTTIFPPVYLYVTGDVSLGGNNGIRNICTAVSSPASNSAVCGSTSNMGVPDGTGTPDRLRLYGLADDGDGSYDQQITINGGSTAGSMFIYAPDALVGINGGSNSPDIYGAVWAKNWNGSSSNNAEITVPDNMAAALNATGISASITLSRTTEPTNWGRLAQF